MKRNEWGFYVEPCPYCGAETTLQDRRYESEGFPYIYICLTDKVVLDARELLSQPRMAAIPRRKASAPIQPRIHPVSPVSDEGLPL